VSVLTALITSLSALACRLSDRQLQILTVGVAGLLYRIYRLSPQRDFIRNNIQAALPLSDAGAHQLAIRHLHYLLESILILLRFPRFSQGKSPVRWQMEGYHHLLRAYHHRRGVILVSAHFGCWELFPALLGLSGFPVRVLVQRPSVPAFDALFTRSRAQAGVETSYNDTISGLRPILRTLKAGGIVGLLFDQHGESQHLIGSFFGHQVSFPEGPFFLRQRTGAAIVPVYTWRTHDRHHIRFWPALPTHDSAQELMQTLYQQLEHMIQQHPAEWLWTYNRWDKYRPCPHP
jgi:KDO2-lipid IV(A) lauroyltransferase